MVVHMVLIPGHVFKFIKLQELLKLCWIRDIREYQVVSGIKIRDGGIRGP